jgi:hypothetical protein
MPNNCRNVLSVIGKQAKEFADKAKGVYPNYRQGTMPPADVTDNVRESQLCFNNFIPVPQGLLERTYGAEYDEKQAEENGVNLVAIDNCMSGYDWQSENWGTKWGTYDEAPVKIKFEDVVEFDFTTAWGPPVNFVATVSKQYPEMTFILSFGGEGPILGRMILKNGAILEDISDATNVLEFPEDEEDEEAIQQYYDKYDEWVNQYIDTQDTYIEEYR